MVVLVPPHHLEYQSVREVSLAVPRPPPLKADEGNLLGCLVLYTQKGDARHTPPVVVCTSTTAIAECGLHDPEHIVQPAIVFGVDGDGEGQFGGGHHELDVFAPLKRRGGGGRIIGCRDLRMDQPREERQLRCIVVWRRWWMRLDGFPFWSPRKSVGIKPPMLNGDDLVLFHDTWTVWCLVAHAVLCVLLFFFLWRTCRLLAFPRTHPLAKKGKRCAVSPGTEEGDRFVGRGDRTLDRSTLVSLCVFLNFCVVVCTLASLSVCLQLCVQINSDQL